MKLGGWGYREDLGGGERERKEYDQIHCVYHSIMNTILGLQFLGQYLSPSWLLCQLLLIMW